ncbi:hypothetical protein N7520_011082 [Penicillium odoratum]|uniref:uncharacterized protein n=1 Tax=Penicillium odoratum TaxID=1167516 RepID=UPI002548DF20|nr:uncharacterized protein N7520_011082 [Penicillium odoratum]KAJ5745900.1 hypothetical protein N7520_011082 [Penicillium odoratum]
MANYPPLVSPGPEVEYVPPRNILASLPDPRSENPPGEQQDVEIPGPVMRAAKIQDIKILKGLVHYGFPPTNYIVGPLNCPWESSVTNALMSGPNFDSHLKFLIESGATPDGFPHICFRVASTRFLRGRAAQDTWTAGCYLRDRPQAMSNIWPVQLRTDQAVPLLEGELEVRHKSRCRFWAESSFPRIDWPTNNPPHPLSVAIEAGNMEIYKYLVDHGSDESAWVDTQKYVSVADDLPTSYFVVQSPLLTSIKNEDISAVRFLLDRGHRPDTFPMVLVTRCMNSVMATLAKRNPWLEGFDLLAPHADLSLLTPIFQCHLLHFAVATLDLSLIRHVIDTMGGPAAAQAVSPTALGHTLLHIASLPIDDSVVNMHSQKIYSSIHEFRTTDEKWVPQRLLSTPPPEPRERGRGGRTQFPGRRGGSAFLRYHQSPRFSDLSQAESEAQASVLLYLLRSGSVPRNQLERQDIHGNTFLHYLVSVRNPDYKLIEKLQDFSEQSAGVWGIRNVYGLSAEDLDSENRAAKAHYSELDHASFWDDNNNSNRW